MDVFSDKIWIAGIGFVGAVLGYLLRFVGTSKSVDVEAAGKLRDQLLKANEQYQLQLQETKAELAKSKSDYEELRRENIDVGHSLQECLAENLQLKKASSVS